MIHMSSVFTSSMQVKLIKMILCSRRTFYVKKEPCLLICNRGAKEKGIVLEGGNMCRA